MTYYMKRMESPVGKIKLVATDQGLAAVLWENDNPKRVRLDPIVEVDDHPILAKAEKQLAKYFDGKLEKFDLPLDMAGTPFQQKVWKALLTIPFGQTRTYSQVARQIGHPKAVRAVGAANGKNPIAIIAPCHRVIGTNGKLTGFAGGLGAKELLLGIEHNHDFKPEKAA